jgi:hypothetical protein
MFTLDDFEHVTNTVLRRLLTYWLDKRCDRVMPSITDIDPIDIPWALSRIWICDYLPESGRFRYRLAGEEINTYWDCRIGGRYLDEIMPAERLEPVTTKLLNVVDGPAIVHDIGEAHLDEELFAKHEQIILPLSDDGHTVSSVLGATHRAGFHDHDSNLQLFAQIPETITVTPIIPNSSEQTVQSAPDP